MLQGLKVVEFATWVAGPSAATVMADWGADVIKIERETGDPVRQQFAERPDLKGNPVFEFENRGKRSVVLDIGKAEGREALLKILQSADIFITNLRLVSLRRAGLDYESVRNRLPKLIYSVVSGFGLQGECADLPAFDVSALWTRSGMAATVIPEGVDPFPCRAGMGDSMCALATIAATLAALTERGRTGRGRLVETSLLRTGVYAMGWDMSIQLKFGQLTTQARTRKHAVNPVGNYFKTKDGRWFGTFTRRPEDWRAIVIAAGREDLVEDARFATPQDRTLNATALVDALDRAFGVLTFVEVSRRLVASDIIWSPLQTMAEVAVDPAAHAAGCFVDVTDAEGDRFMSPASPARFPGADLAPARRAPRLGEHTREILAENGYSPAEIAQLLSSGAAQQLPDA